MRPVVLSARTPDQPKIPQWVIDNLKQIETASRIDVIAGVNPSGAALSTINNASAGQFPYFTGATTVALGTLSPFAILLLSSAAAGSVTLTVSATTTTVTSATCTAASKVFLSPRTANAAAALATTFVTPSVGSFVITHASNTQTDRTFDYVVIGA